jgi:hypothetical protein
MKEATNPVSLGDEARVVALLSADLEGTVGPGYRSTVEEAAARILEFAESPDDFETRVVEDVQQTLHDTFVDTAWPRCPDHPHHPLWYSDKLWTCHRSGKRFAELGGLAAIVK